MFAQHPHTGHLLMLM